MNAQGGPKTLDVDFLWISGVFFGLMAFFLAAVALLRMGSDADSDETGQGGQSSGGTPFFYRGKITEDPIVILPNSVVFTGPDGIEIENEDLPGNPEALRRFQEMVRRGRPVLFVTHPNANITEYWVNDLAYEAGVREHSYIRWHSDCLHLHRLDAEGWARYQECLEERGEG